MPDKSLGFLGQLTLRQLRKIASDLGIEHYSRQSKYGLCSAIYRLQKVQSVDRQKFLIEDDKPVNKSKSVSRAAQPGCGTCLVFLPRDPQWAYVFWDISDVDRERAQASGASYLCLRLADVTGLPGGSSHPHTLQEVNVDSNANEWYLPMPLSDRDYRIELGFRGGASGQWFSLAFSSVARVPALHPSEQILDQFVPFSLDNSAPSPALAETPAEAKFADSGLHERVYQSATSRWRSLGRGSEAFHESNAAAGDWIDSALHASGAGLWASGRHESGLGGVSPRQRSFWLVADAELIVYGATDPSARLSIGGEEIPLSAEGTFRVQVPFRDGQQIYPIEAVAVDGEQRRSITLEFQRSTPEDNSAQHNQELDKWF